MIASGGNSAARILLGTGIIGAANHVSGPAIQCQTSEVAERFCPPEAEKRSPPVTARETSRAKLSKGLTRPECWTGISPSTSAAVFAHPIEGKIQKAKKRKAAKTWRAEIVLPHRSEHNLVSDCMLLTAPSSAFSFHRKRAS